MTRSKHEAYFAQLWEQQAAKRERFAAGGSPQSTSGGNTNTPRGASACSPCVASHGESACGVQVDSEARCGAPDPVAVPTQRGRASSIHAPSEKVPAGSESPLSAGLRSTSGGVESRHAGSAASLNWGVGAAQVKTASADTTADLSGESGMPSVQLRPAGMRPEVRPHADNQGTAGVAPGPLTLNAAAKDARPSTSRGGVVPVPTSLVAAPIQRGKADAATDSRPRAIAGNWLTSIRGGAAVASTSPLHLAWPPTGNHTVKHAQGGHYVTRETIAYRQGVAHACARYAPIAGRYRLLVHLSPPDKRARDIDNALKSLFDALVKAHFLPSDSMQYMRELHVTVDDERRGRVTVVAQGME